MPVALTWQPFRLPLRSPFAAAHGTLGDREGLLLRLSAPGGEEGLGEASPLPSFAGGSLTETAAALAVISRAAAGLPVERMWPLEVPLDGFSPGSAAAARCGFETAVADLLARRADLPLAAWLARASGAPVPRSPVIIPVNAVIDASSPEDAAGHARAFAARGYSTFKVKVGLGLEQDAARLDAIRASLPVGAALRIDANGAWGHEDVALAALERLSAFGVALCEQPLAPAAGLEALAFVARHSPVPIAIDEGCRSLADLRDVARLRAADAVVVKPMVTGLREALAMLTVAREAGLAAIVTTTFDSGVGTMAAAHLAALLPPPIPACGLSAIEYLQRDIVAGVPPIVRGHLALGDRPGLGVELDAGGLAVLAVGPAVGAPP